MTIPRTADGKPASTLPKLGRYRRRKINNLRAARGIPSYTNSEPIAQHIDWLHDLGFTNASIAAGAGVGVSTVRQIVIRQFPKVHIETGARIKAVTHRPTPAQAGLKVPALGAVRRLHALNALGWTYDAIGARIGMTGSAVSKLVGPKRIMFEAWDAIRIAYDAMSAEPGESLLTRKRAATKGIQPPLAWEGVDIDHPDSVPVTEVACADRDVIDEVLVARILAGEHHGPIPTAERTAVIDHAARHGWTGRQLATVLNNNLAAADRALVRRRNKIRQEQAA
ncbi:hypothetical protein IU449_26710 [Nocardia higoensis]|uniref:Uncharacterized protein n=1 Tax=Nocardia higoensis TaxID=228599 RepID=A0ABS0DHZ5_9NOCA|nr:hypothetical protein [Nocardia higoensis]MBF6358091.1 hypothetical protein [Nocardia higoensis]